MSQNDQLNAKKPRYKLILQAVNDNIHASRNPRYAGNVKNLIFDHVGSLE